MTRKRLARRVLALGLAVSLAAVCSGCAGVGRTSCQRRVGPPMWREIGRSSWDFHVPVESSPSYGYHSTCWRSWPGCDGGSPQWLPDGPSEPEYAGREYPLMSADSAAGPHLAPPRSISSPAGPQGRQ